MRHHGFHLYSFANGIRQYSFQAIPGLEGDIQYIPGQQNQQSVVIFRLADTPPVEQRNGKFMRFLFSDAVQGDNCHFYGQRVLQLLQYIVDFILRFTVQYMVRVGYPIVRIVCLGVRYIIDRSPCHRAETHQNGYTDYKFSYHIVPPFS